VELCGFIGNTFKTANMIEAGAFKDCWAGVGTFTSKRWFKSNTMQLKIFAGPRTVLHRLCSMEDGALDRALPGIADHVAGVRVLRELKKTVEEALGVPVDNVRFILSFVRGLKAGAWLLEPHPDGGATYAGLHVCAAGDAICTTEYVLSRGRKAPVVKSTGGALSYFGNDVWHGRAKDSTMLHRVVLSKEGYIRIGMLVDVSETPNLKLYDDYLSKLPHAENAWTPAIVESMKAVAKGAPKLKQRGTLPNLSTAQEALRNSRRAPQREVQ
jgi:hypothetical protein